MKHTANWPRIFEGNVCCTIFFVAAGVVLLQERLHHSRGALVMARPNLADANCLHWHHQSIFTGSTLHFYSFFEWFVLPEQCTMAHRLKSGALPFHIVPCFPPFCLHWGPVHLHPCFSSPALLGSRDRLIIPALQPGNGVERGETA